MKKLGLVAAALGAVVIALPSIASAQTVVIDPGGGGGYHRHDRGWRAHAEMRGRDRGWHREHHHSDRVVVIKRRHHRDW